MTFLPIVTRELSVAARRPLTYYIRPAIALLALVIGSVVFAVVALIAAMGGSSGVPPGVSVFYALARYLFVMCLLAGVFLAADCLSEERRNGTLGLLFLTDLKSYDIVLGKLIAVSLNAVYGLLAVFPILGISILVGGLTGAEFGRMCLALGNALWFSITAALWVSSGSESSNRAAVNTVALLVFLVLVLPVVTLVFSVSPLAFHISSISPFEAFQSARADHYLSQPTRFWSALGVSHLAGWLFLVLACWRLGRVFQDGAVAAGTKGWAGFLTGDLLAGRKKRLPALLELNPVLWILEDSRRLRLLVWGLCVAGSAVLLLAGALGTMGAAFLSYIAWPFYFLLKVFFTLQTCRFFSEARRSGTLELLWTTPLSDKTMISGQGLALKRVFLWPVVMLMSAEVLATLFSLGGPISARSANGFGYILIFIVLRQVGNSVADFFAIFWCGTWLALTIKKPQNAAGLTILFVLLLPMIAMCLPTVVIDAVLIAVFHAKLTGNLRQAHGHALPAN